MENPYVGPRAFQRGERLYGRDEDVDALVDLILAERIVLLHSPSGAGKTSLIEAALRQRLEEEAFRVLPTLRVSFRPFDAAGLPVERNPYLLSLVLALDSGAEGSGRAVSELAATTFRDYVDGMATSSSGSNGFHVLVFDQFEEVFCLDYLDEATLKARKDFFAQVGEVLRDQKRFALFSMREDFLGQLEPFLRYLPTRLDTTCRLEFLNVSNAKKAIAGLAQDAGARFEPEALENLVDGLSRVLIETLHGPEERRALFVQPLRLQTLCRSLWNELAQNGALADGVVRAEHTSSAAKIAGQAVVRYYERTVARAAADSGLDERPIRDWFGTRLVTVNGYRDRAVEGPAPDEPDRQARASRVLLDASLVQAETRFGESWYELAHDGLIEAVQTSNTLWEISHLRPLQWRSRIWLREHRNEGLLLRGTELEAEEQWASQNSDRLSKGELEFLRACRGAREQGERV